MKCSWDRIDITPILPVRLSGFGKVRWAEESHDAIYARLFLFQGEQESLLVQLDLVAVDDFLTSLVAKKSGLKKEQVVLMATHTHSAPTGTLNTASGTLRGLESIFGELNTSYCEKIAAAISASVCQMRNELKSFSYRVLRGEIEGLGSDRHDASLPYDKDMLALELKREDGTKAMLIRMSCHPTVMNQDNLLLSADFPGAVEPLFPEYELVAYVNGSCGNMSTRFTRQGNGFEEVARFGSLIEKQLRELLKEKIPFKDNFTLSLKQTEIELPVKKVDTVEEATNKLMEAKKKLDEAKEQKVDDKKLRVLESVYEGAQNNLFVAKNKPAVSKLMLPVSWIQLPELNLVTVPCELFSTLSDSVKKELNAEFIGYTNGYFLYLPDEDSFRKQVYESFSSPFAAGGGEILMQEIKNWMNK